MRKLTALLLAVFMGFALAACNGNNPGTNAGTSEPDKAPANTAPGGSGTLGGSQAEDGSDSSEDNSTDTVRILVAYFSATNTTEGVAKTIADGLGADLYEITPEQPYTDADLNYHDDNSRSTIEMNDPNARPAISGSVENMEQYDIVFLGYPIWWGEAPRILNTFMESYDFSGKTIVPFCTSGSSDVGSSAKNLTNFTEGATWLGGTRFEGGSSRETIVDWVNNLGLDIIAE